MKRRLSLVLALLMIFSSVVPVLAKTTDEKIQWLVDRNYVEGYEDGSLKLENKITRAEMAKMVIKIKDKKDLADQLKDIKSKFNDVDLDHWANGYINAAVKEGYIKGYEDGSFRPDSFITNEEVITIIARLHPDFIEDKILGTDWSKQFVDFAGKSNLLDGVVIGDSLKDYALRRTTFEIFYNYLHELINRMDRIAKAEREKEKSSNNGFFDFLFPYIGGNYWNPDPRPDRPSRPSEPTEPSEPTDPTDPTEPVKKVKVTFDSNGGSKVEAVEVEKGKTVEKPADPTREGFEFVGWYLGNEKFDFASPVNENITLKAVWSQIEPAEELIFKPALGTRSFVDEAEVEISLGVVNKEGEDLTSETEFTAENLPEGLEIAGNHIIGTLEPLTWEENETEREFKVSVTAKSNGLEVTEEITIVIRKAADKTELEKALEKAKALTPADTTSEDGTDVPTDETWVTQDVQDILDSKIKSAENAMKDKSATQKQVDDATKALNDAIEAYNPQKGTKAPEMLTVTFDSNGGSEVEAIEVEKGKTVEKPDDPTKDDLTFEGWFLEGVEFDFTKPIDENITLKARWSTDLTPIEPILTIAIDEIGPRVFDEKAEVIIPLTVRNDEKEIVQADLTAQGLPQGLELKDGKIQGTLEAFDWKDGETERPFTVKVTAKLDSAEASQEFVLTVKRELKDFNITYKFVSGTEGKELPDQVKALLPESGTAKEGSNVSPASLEKTEVIIETETEVGKWTFKGFEPAQVDSIEANTEFIGTWEYEKIPMSEYYKPVGGKMTWVKRKDQFDHNKPRISIVDVTNSIIYNSPSIVRRGSNYPSKLINWINDGKYSKGTIVEIPITINYKDGSSEDVIVKVKIVSRVGDPFYDQALNEKYTAEASELIKKVGEDLDIADIYKSIKFNSPEDDRIDNQGKTEVKAEDLDAVNKATEPGDYFVTYTITYADKTTQEVKVKVKVVDDIEYKIEYSFQAADGSNLPDQVKALVPASKVIEKGEKIQAQQPSQTEYLVETLTEVGKWIFTGYKLDEANSTEDNFKFIGTWVYKNIPMNEFYKPEGMKITSKDLFDMGNGEYNSHNFRKLISYNSPQSSFTTVSEISCSRVIKRLKAGKEKIGTELKAEITLKYKDGTETTVPIIVKVSNENTKYTSPLSEQFKPYSIIVEKKTTDEFTNHTFRNAINFNSPEYLRIDRQGFEITDQPGYKNIKSKKPGDYTVNYKITYIDNSFTEIDVTIRVVE
ncbi:InlB B-repeat-containing protein [Neofamilia massiliensis]|uniref:InlB B-repeat-containing protein n=1 Tax=Neofamilia massiliensis TaxID=1673724 RepID=UPI0006BB7686|nr:InlB B-repeat-containing protein [Neofamilia massiliensis]